MVPRLQILAAAALFSTGGVAIKITELSAWQVAGGRSLLAALLFAAIYRVEVRAFTWRACLSGIAYAATMVGFVVANKLTTAANSIFLQSTAPLYIVILAPILLGETRKRHDGPVCLLIAIGLALFFFGHDPEFASAPNPLAGNLLAACDGVFWAFTLISIRWLGDDRQQLAAALILGNSFAAVAVAPLALPIAAGAVDLLAVLYLGIFQIVVAYLFMTAGIRRVATLEASVLLLMEPVLSTILAFLVFGEYPGLLSSVGAACVIAASALKTAGDIGAARYAR